MHRHGKMQSELARLGLELTICQSELARTRQDMENARQRAEHAKNQHAVAALSRAEAESESTRLADELVALRGSIQSQQNELAAGRAQFAAMHQRLMAPEPLSLRPNHTPTHIQPRQT